MSELAVEATQLTKKFGGIRAVNGASLSFPGSEIRGVIGPNGAGKTTLLNILSGVDRPTSGRYRFFSVDATGWSLHRTIHEGRVARTFQTVRLFESMSVLDNIAVAAGAAKGETKLAWRGAHRSVTARAQEMVDRMQLEDVAHARVTELPYGIRRMVEIARALCMNPRVLLLDEPAAGLNTAERERLGELLLQLKQEGLSIVLVEHQMDLVSSVCDQLTVLDFGEVICEGKPADVISDSRVVEAYIGAGDADA